MPLAFVLINAMLGQEDEVVDELRKIGNVKESYTVYGAFDILAKVEAESMDKLEEIVTWKIRRLDKVRSTLTMIAIDGTNSLECDRTVPALVAGYLTSRILMSSNLIL